MSQENVETVRRMYRAFHGGDAEGALALFDAEAVIDATRSADGGIGQGHQALTTIIGGWVGAFDDWREVIEEIRDLGSHVFVLAIQRGRGKQSGVDVETRYAVLFEVARAKITAMTLYPDPAEALEVAGAHE
jgi:ketosteroid isomerase-like protein